MRKTKLIFITGVSGTGKTTLGKILAKETGFMFLDNDTIADSYVRELCILYGVDENDRDSKVYVEKIKPIEYRAFFNVLTENLRLGVSAIVPIVFRRYGQDPLWLERFMEKEGLNNIDVKVIQLTLEDENSLKNRILERNNPRDDWKLNNWEQYITDIKGYDIKWTGIEKLVIDNSSFEVNDRIKEIKQFIED